MGLGEFGAVGQIYAVEICLSLKPLSVPPGSSDSRHHLESKAAIVANGVSNLLRLQRFDL